MPNRDKPSRKGKSALKSHFQDPSLKELIGVLERKSLRYTDLIPRESLIEKIIYLLLEGPGPWRGIGPIFDRLIAAFNRYSTETVRTVIFGGGTGLSGIVGGDTSLETWGKAPFRGMKHDFPNLTLVACVTDDGGSSGKLLRTIPCIAVGDLRRAILASMTPRNLLKMYPSLQIDRLETLAASLQKILSFRFMKSPDPFLLQNPGGLLTPNERQSLPENLLEYLGALGSAFTQHPSLKTIGPEDQCLGNLLLVASIYSQRESLEGNGPPDQGSLPFCPTPSEIVKGIQTFAERIGSGIGTIYPATSTQGELQVLYQHGVASSGQEKLSRRHSSFPVHRMWVHFVSPPWVAPELLKKITEADLIVLAPGSLFSSVLPIFQIPSITEAVRANKRALKILAANFWAQRGETDISSRRGGKEYFVSELIEAYHHNTPGGVGGLFGPVIVTDLQSVSGDVLRNYALEGKVPIYLDKQRVREMGFQPIEAAAFSEEKLLNDKVIQHDPEKFARVVKMLYYLRGNLERASKSPRLGSSHFSPKVFFPREGFLCEHWQEICQRVQQMDIAHPRLRRVLSEMLWNNREILLEHLSFVAGIQVIRTSKWARSTEWDNILGYYDPEDGYIKIHEYLLKEREDRLMEDILVALGESLLGNYYQTKSIREIQEGDALLGKVFEIHVRPLKDRNSFLRDAELKEYLDLAHLRPLAGQPDRFCMLINGNDAFTPPGLLFGLLYAWYCNNRFGGVIDYEMSLLRWKISELIPKPSMERTRLQAQVEFFRRVVFRQRIPRAVTKTL